jgi:hypothetical protein
MDEILYGGDGIVYYLHSTLYNSVASTIPKWLTIKLLKCVQLLNQSVDLVEILYGGDGIEGDVD